MMKWLPFLLAFAALASAQIQVTPLRDSAPAETAQGSPLLAQAQAAAEAARADGEVPSPDSPNWRSAINLGEEARDASPENPQVLRFLAETYSTVLWYSRAWEAWDAYLKAGGTRDEGALRALSEAGQQLGYARYNGGDLDGAATLFGRLLELDETNANALTWLGRIALEQGRSQQAERFWSRVLTLQPGNRTARYYLQRAEQQRTFGAEASQAFNEGLTAYDANRKAEALEAFSRAAGANPQFSDAFSWAGRVALELGRPQAAKTFWQALLQRNPQNRQARYFLELAQAQERWGSEAGRAFYTGQERYNGGRIREAAEAFVRASEANPRYPAAASWAARSLQESGQTQRAIPYWQRVVALNPDDESAKFFLEAARTQNVSGEALSAFNEGLQAYQEADLGSAESAFRTATQRDPTYADAWGWLGRLAFESGRYADAETAYARAAELEPENVTYSFFRGEAQRLGTE